MKDLSRLCQVMVSSNARKGNKTHGGICHKVTQGWFPGLYPDFSWNLHKFDTV